MTLGPAPDASQLKCATLCLVEWSSFTRETDRGGGTPKNTRSMAMAQREPERQYGLSIMQVATPFLILGATILLALAVTARF